MLKYRPLTFFFIAQLIITYNPHAFRICFTHWPPVWTFGRTHTGHYLFQFVGSGHANISRIVDSAVNTLFRWVIAFKILSPNMPFGPCRHKSKLIQITSASDKGFPDPHALSLSRICLTTNSQHHSRRHFGNMPDANIGRLAISAPTIGDDSSSCYLSLNSCLVRSIHSIELGYESRTRR
jgi:hypothetical protein